MCVCVRRVCMRACLHERKGDIQTRMGRGPLNSESEREVSFDWKTHNSIVVFFSFFFFFIACWSAQAHCIVRGTKYVSKGQNRGNIIDCTHVEVSPVSQTPMVVHIYIAYLFACITSVCGTYRLCVDQRQNKHDLRVHGVCFVDSRFFLAFSISCTRVCSPST